MKLTPQALRLISGAVSTLPDRKVQEMWYGWVGASANDDLPYEIAEIALSAVNSASQRLRSALDSASLDEDTEADLLNDLGFVCAIEQGLKREGVGH